MKKIDINETLLQRLKADYNNAEDQVKFMNGLDYLEAMVKLFGVLNISVVKEIDKDVYEKIFFNNFKKSPSLGDYKSLATKLFLDKDDGIDKELKIYETLKAKDILYDKLYDLFTSKINNLKLDNILKIMEDGIAVKLTKKTNNPTTLQELFDNYVVTFRNKLKGHGASFSPNDQEQAKIILDNLAVIITIIESKIDELLKDKALLFFAVDDDTNNENYTPLKVIAKYRDKEYQLSPLMIYLECNKFSCKDEHKVKLFFYNDGGGKKASKSYYIDYSYNHYYYFSSNNEVDTILKEIVNTQKELNAHDTSDNLRQSDFLSIFVGREEELKLSQKHIINNIASNTPSAITIKGKPGIGKSAFITKLQEELTEKVEELQTYIFYARKSDISDDDEEKEFYNKLSGYLKNINISIPKPENYDQLLPKERLEHVFETLNTALKKPLLLVIDGLDEFAKPVSFLKNFPMKNIPNKLHIVFSTRGYTNILETLQIKFSADDCNFNLLYKDKYSDESTSITLGKLSDYEVETLIGEVLTKDVQRGTKPYRNIQSEIYEKSEGLPLYVHYISSKLVEFDLKSSNIAKDILAYAKELPKGLKAFYFQSFEKLKTISSQILYTLYFSHKNIGFDSFYHLLTGLKNKDIDDKKFQNKYFNEVEIFLTKDNEKYGFYHLSVKESIKSYFMQEGNLQAIVEIDYDTFSENMPIAPYQEEQYKETFDTYYYLNKKRGLFKFLKKIYEYLSGKQNDEDLSELYKDNYLTYFYKYIYFSNYSEIVSFKDMKKKDYKAFENTILSNNITDLIQKFFKDYESSLKQDISEIKYAHQFALLTNDYDRVLSYAKDYEDAFLILFVDIVWNLNSPKNQKLFKELKPIWSEIYGDDFKLILLHNRKLCNYLKYMIEIANSTERVEYRSKELASIVHRTDDLDKALEIANSIENNRKKSEALASIVSRTDDLDKALEIANSIEQLSKRIGVLVSIASRTDDVDKAWEIVNSIEKGLGIVYASIESKTDDVDKALEIVNIIEDDGEKQKR